MAKGTRTEGLRPELPLRAAVRVGQYKSVILKREAFVSQKNRRFQQTSPCRRPRRAISRTTNTEVRRAECDSVGTAVALRANSTSSQSELGRSVCFLKEHAVSANSPRRSGRKQPSLFSLTPSSARQGAASSLTQTARRFLHRKKTKNPRRSFFKNRARIG